MRSFIKFALSALAIFIFLSSNAVELPTGYFAPASVHHASKATVKKAAHGKKKNKLKHKKPSRKGPVCYAY